MQPDSEPKTTSCPPRSHIAGALPYQCCRNCSKNGLPVHLKELQINLNESVYVCTQHECYFPLMEANMESYITSRTLDKCLSSMKNPSTYYFPPNDMKLSQIHKRNVLSEENLLELQKQQTEYDKVLATSFSLSSYLTVNSMQTSTGSANNLCCDGVSIVAQSLKSDPTDETASMSPAHSVQSENSFSALHKKCKKEIILENPCIKENMLENSVVGKSLGVDTTQNLKKNIQSNPGHNKLDLAELPPPSRQSIMLQWQNESNLCWLDVLLHCIVHSNLIRMTINCNRQVCSNNSALFYRLCSTFDEIQADYQNLTAKYADLSKIPIYETLYLRCKLSQARIGVLKLLETSEHMKGTPESAMELFPAIIKLDSALKDLFTVDVRWGFRCGKCGHTQNRRTTTPIVSFPSTTPYFHPLNATFLRPCFKCQAKDESMTMTMERIPPCLMMHFLRGLPHNQVQVMDFGIQGFLYSVCALIQYTTKPCNHFIVWIRDTKANKWLCCDDLKDPTCSWRMGTPKIPAEEIHMLMWEKQVAVSTLTPVNGAPDDRKKHLRNIINEAVFTSDEDDSPEMFTDPDETIDLTDLASTSSNKDVECNEKDASPTMQSSFFEDDNPKSLTHHVNEDAGLTNVFNELNNKEDNDCSMSELLKNQFQEHIASERSDDKSGDESVTHPSKKSLTSSSHLNPINTLSSPIFNQTSCSNVEGPESYSPTGLEKLRRKRKKDSWFSSSSSESDEIPHKKLKTEDSSSRRLEDYFHVPSSMLKSILSPVVVMTDCLKTVSESSRNRLLSTSDDDHDFSTGTNNSFEHRSSHNEQSCSSPVSVDRSACSPSKVSGDMSQHDSMPLNLPDTQLSFNHEEEVEKVSHNFDSSVSSANSPVKQEQTEPSTNLSESYINVLKFKKKSSTAVEPYRFTGKANYFSQNNARTCHEFSSNDPVESASSDCKSAEYICVAPQLGSEEDFTKHSFLPLKEVNSQLDLGSNSNMLLTHHYDKNQPLKSLLIVNPPSVKDSVCKASEKVTPAQPDEKEAFPNINRDEDSSEDDYEDDVDEWKPSWDKRRQKEAKERLERQIRFIKPPSTQTVTFLNLPVKTKPVKSKLLVPDGIFKSYVSKGTNTQHKVSNIHHRALKSESQESRKTKAQLNTRSNYIIPDNQNTSRMLKKKKMSSESTSDAVNLVHQDFDSGYGGNGSRCSSVAGDQQNDLPETSLNSFTNPSRDLHPANLVQPGPTISCPHLAPDLSSQSNPPSTSNDLEDLLDSLPLEMNLSINSMSPKNLASNDSETKELVSDVFDFSEDLFSFLNL